MRVHGPEVSFMSCFKGAFSKLGHILGFGSVLGYILNSATRLFPLMKKNENYIISGIREFNFTCFDPYVQCVR